MEPYVIDRSSNSRRKSVEEWLFGLDLVQPKTRDAIVTAWVSAWSSSPYATLEEMPFTPGAPDYLLKDHVNEVTRAGLDLMKRAETEWGRKVDAEIMLPILILHDVDKPLIYARVAPGKVDYSPLGRELPHGVVGGMLLKELGFPHLVVSTVATHASNAPFHGPHFEAYLLHYADLFAADYAFISGGKTPLYQKRGK